MSPLKNTDLVGAHPWKKFWKMAQKGWVADQDQSLLQNLWVNQKINRELLLKKK